ncbi:N-acetylmuramoyl-L-alanine amidase [Actinospica sp. MGRD01-02]|uniref:N-acetylmuramoyl-L-alanine amidase n=1 Tax=Actinospica acidithermotolerans TaxID=2828514 RepID=A0A941E9J0_9ACTN|nr:N-acetylmuramoyl-L-alanine amidase [Actinospica acidithermotolerans]MBR7827072.1 N-acetylmuramoyl-L-alanine amidase [Actinospica acidithermotolerans]
MPATGASSAASALAANGVNGASPSSTASATVSPAASSPAAALAGKTVVIDPGHNGGNASHAAEIAKLVPMGFGQTKTCDTTGTNADDGYPEYQFNLQVSVLVEQILEQHGAKVIMTRTTDDGVGPCVDQRAAIGNDAHADAAISIHGDGFASSGHGFQIIQATRSEGGAANDARSDALSKALHATFLAESGETPATYIGDDGYETRSDLAGLNLSTVPKVLVECGNMKNPGDIALMESSAGRAKLAAAIADGIIDFLENR